MVVLQEMAWQRRAVQQLTEEIMAVQGVEDMQIFMDEQTAYLKVDKKQLDKAALQHIVPHVK